jgi:glycosyltransferase involved in cell wall biosynthesis
MYRSEFVAVVVPAYNEGAHVREVVETLPSMVDRAYVVDDASTDDTWAEIRAAVRSTPASRTLDDDPDDAVAGRAADAPGDPGVPDGGQSRQVRRSLPEELPVRVHPGDADPAIVAVRHGENRGRGAAIKTGYRLAMNDDMDVVAVMDGDGQMDPDQLERVVHPVATGQADYAKGNRLDGPEYWREMSGWRLFGNALLTALTSVSTGYWGLRDPQNGYTAIARSTLADLPLDALYDDYGFLNDMLGELSIVGARVTDVALPAVYGDEESGIRYGQFVPAVSTLLLVNFLRRLYVDGARRGHVCLPAAYGLAGGSWLSAAAALAGLFTGGGPPSVAAAGVAGGPAGLVATAAVATLLALVLDRRVNAVLDDGETTVVGQR